MPLYLGSEKVDFTIGKINIGAKCTTGTAICDDEGKVTFPPLDFTPTLIAIWNVKTRDLKSEAIEEGWGDDWDDSFVRYVHTGVMLFAVYYNGEWYTQASNNNSGEAYVSGATWETMRDESRKCLQIDGNIYSYRPSRNAYTGDDENFIGETFNYAIYGE